MPFLPILAQLRVPTPRYRVNHAVPVDLLTSTEIVDARRDGSAIGTSSWRMVSESGGSALYVVRGKVRLVDSPSEGDGTPYRAPKWNPVALLGGDRVAVSWSASPDRTPRLRAATVGGPLRIGARIKGSRPRPAAHGDFGPERPPRALPETWWRPRLETGGNPKPLTVRYARTPSDVVLGEGAVDPNTGNGIAFTPQYVAVLRDGRTEWPLRDYVRGLPDLGEILWISPQGWLVCTALSGERTSLVWLEPIRAVRRR